MGSPHEYYEWTHDRGRCGTCKGPKSSPMHHTTEGAPD